jgi:hypothetical protein
MGIFDIMGTTASGWLTDRFSSRYLLCTYYALRGLSLLILPHTLAHGGAAGSAHSTRKRAPAQQSGPSLLFYCLAVSCLTWFSPLFFEQPKQRTCFGCRGNGLLGDELSRAAKCSVFGWQWRHGGAAIAQQQATAY